MKAKTKGAKKAAKKAYAAFSAAKGASTKHGTDLPKRHPGGQAVRVHEPAPTTAKRMEVFGISESLARSDLYGSEIGRMLREDETFYRDDYDACVWFHAAWERYRRAIGGPAMDGELWGTLEREGGRSVNSAADNEADRRAMLRWQEIDARLHEVNPATLHILRATVNGDRPVEPKDRQIWIRGVAKLRHLMKYA